MASQVNFKMGTDIELAPPQLGVGVADTGFLTMYEDILCKMGSKYTPHKMKGGGVYHNDGVFTEFAPNTGRDHVELLANVMRMHTFLEVLTGLTLTGFDYVTLPEMSELELPFLYEEAHTMGCAPDTKDGVVRVVPTEVKHRNVKEAGLHLHLDLPARVLATIEQGRGPKGEEVLIETSDYINGFAKGMAEALSEFHSSSHPVYELWYRQPGVYRIKPYGIEYRSIGAGVFSDQDRLATMMAMAEQYTKDYWRTYI